MRHQGRITTWKDDQGFGFITPNLGGEPVFVHIKTFTSRQRPAGNEIVTYELTSDEKGRPQARNVAYVAATRRARQPVSSGPSRIPLFLAAAFLFFVAFSALTARLPLAVLGLYAGASLLTFAAYALDKSAAKAARWRTQESTLHLFALIGGWPGALVAQNQLRHKTRKMPFQLIYWMTVTVNCAALGWALR